MANEQQGFDTVWLLVLKLVHKEDIGVCDHTFGNAIAGQYFLVKASKTAAGSKGLSRHAFFSDRRKDVESLQPLSEKSKDTIWLDVLQQVS